MKKLSGTVTDGAMFFSRSKSRTKEKKAKKNVVNSKSVLLAPQDIPSGEDDNSRASKGGKSNKVSNMSFGPTAEEGHRLSFDARY